MNGFFNILKPTGMSSAAVVAVMRRLTGEKRVGHAGTLDPEAAGVLPIMTGKAARLFDYLTRNMLRSVLSAAGRIPRTRPGRSWRPEKTIRTGKRFYGLQQN